MAGPSRWKDLSEQQRWRASTSVGAHQPVDDDVVLAALDLQRSNKRLAVHLAWVGPLLLGPTTAILLALVASRESERGLLPIGLHAVVFTLPLAALFCGVAALWSYWAADAHERRLMAQLGEPADRPPPASHAARSVGRAVIALLAGLVLTLLALFPVGALLFLVSMAGVPIDAIPEEVGWALGAVALVVVTARSYRWLRSDARSPLRLEGRATR